MLFFALQSEKVPVKIKAAIIGALGYFISPLDLIPDLIPGVGFADDLGALAAALGLVWMYLDDDIREKAKAQYRAFFGDDPPDL